jgi:polyhydroxyalkanoate synthesis regulator phasin
MVDKGKISETEGKKLVDEWIEKAETAREHFQDRVKEMSQQFGFAEKSDEEELARLKKKVTELEVKLGKPHHATKKAVAV